jgi:signal transduction histidine kinase
MDDAKTLTPEERLGATEEALRRSEQRSTAGQLALELMHEIRNPLESLSHLIYLARERANDPELARQYLHWAEEQMVLLGGIVNQTLDFAQPSHATRTIDLAVLTESALRIHQKKIAEKNIRLVKRLGDEVMAEVHRGEVLQVISNLIVNALDALPASGTLHLRLRKSEGKVHFLIADNGHGIPAENIESIFQAFFTTKEERGTGLGLALVKKIVERHDGKIRVRSSIREGRKGTAFKVSLPTDHPTSGKQPQGLE